MGKSYLLFLNLFIFGLIFFSCDLDKIEPEGNSLFASFSYYNGGCKAPCQVDFTNTSIGANRYEWDFGDGSPIDTHTHPVHTFQVPGDYQVELKVFGISGIDVDSQVINIQVSSFVQQFGGLFSDTGNQVQQTSDGGYIIVGCTFSLGAGWGDVYLIKTNSSGEIVWEKTFGGSGYDLGSSVQQTSDGGYIIVGFTSSYGFGSSDVYLIKTNSSGGIEWEKTFGGSAEDYGNSVQQTIDGGFIVVGTTYSLGAGEGDVYLIKTNSSGEIVWEKTFGGSDYDRGSSVQQTPDGGYIIVGDSQSYLGDQGEEVYLIKINSLGGVVWEKTFGGNSPGSDIGNQVQQTSDGGYVISGLTFSYGVSWGDVYLIKTNSAGGVIWEKTFGGSDHDGGWAVQQTSDGGYIIAGNTYSLGVGGGDGYLLKTNSSGGVIWEKTFGGIDDDCFKFVHQAVDGGYIIVGYTESSGAGSNDIYLIKTDMNGNVQ
ncbi:MAG: PKD domain-containing protein [Saprospiraceae bacterium]